MNDDIGIRVRSRYGISVREPRVLVSHVEDFGKPIEDVGMSFERARLLFEALASHAYKIAELWYLMHHDRLPGSQRTSRLRKKRGRVIAEWVRKQIK